MKRFDKLLESLLTVKELKARSPYRTEAGPRLRPFGKGRKGHHPAGSEGSNTVFAWYSRPADADKINHWIDQLDPLEQDWLYLVRDDARAEGIDQAHHKDQVENPLGGYSDPDDLD